MHEVSDVEQTAIHADESLVPERNPSENDIVIEYLKNV
jgi:hypothetical protein